MRIFKRATDILLKLALAYVFLAAFLYFYQRQLMYAPDEARPDPALASFQGIELAQVTTDDSLNLEGWYFPPRTPKMPVILWFHGNAGNHGGRLDRIGEYREAGYGVLLASYRGYAGNHGSPSEEGLYADGRAYVRWLQGRGSSIVLYGESLGSGVAVQMATEFDIRALVLEAPFTAVPDVARRKYFFVPVDLLVRDQFRNIDKIGAVEEPLLILHGERDETVPYPHGRVLFNAAGEPKKFVAFPQAGHGDLYENGAALHVLGFLSNIGG